MKIYKTLFLLAFLMISKSMFAQVVGVRQPIFPNVTPTVGEGYLAFYNNWNASGDIVLTYGNHANYPVNLKTTSPSGANDEIKSVVVVGPLTNATWVLFDNPSGQLDDDYAVITVNGSIPAGTSVTIPSLDIGAAPGVFYNDGAGNTVTETFYHHNGLDGKVSRISRYIGQ